jgi:hypothetical protein
VPRTWDKPAAFAGASAKADLVGIDEIHYEAANPQIV